MQMSIVVLFLICILSTNVNELNAITCYECTNCPVPFNASILGVTQAQCSGACRKTVTTQVFQVSTIVKKCDTNCTELNSGLLGLGTYQSCCYSDLCNDAQIITSLNKSIMISFISLIVYCLYK